MTHTKDEALISLITELVGTVALHDMEKARKLGKRVHLALEQQVQEPRPSFADVVRAEPTELIQKWRVLELYRAYEHCQFQATPQPSNHF
jgi:hypothetical protein